MPPPEPSRKRDRPGRLDPSRCPGARLSGVPPATDGPLSPGAGPPLFLISEDAALARTVRSILRDADVTTVACLRTIPEVGHDTRLLIDPRPVRSCCLQRLGAWRERLRPRQVVFLSLPAPPEVLLELPLAFPGTVARLDDLGRLLRVAVLSTEARSAWAARSRILAREGRPRQACRLLETASAHDHQPFSVSQLAEVLCTGVRQLNRLSRQWFGYSPGVIIRLVRVSSVVQEISTTAEPLKVVAAAYGFRGKNVMAQEVRRFAGLLPRAHRGRAILPGVSETREAMSEMRRRGQGEQGV